MYQLFSQSFPKDFIFGIADADLQVIGEKHTQEHEKSELTMWTHFAQNSGKVYLNQTPLEGIDRYNRWQEDIEIIKKLGVKHYRVSLSMSRIMTKEKKPNLKAIEWYTNYFKALKEAGLTLYATIYHWELPQYLSKMGGWKNRIVCDYLVEHAKIVYEYFHEYIEEYFILNEPFQFTLDSYHAGVHAPGETSLKAGIQALHHALLAQGMVFHELKKINPQIKLSTVYNPSITYSYSTDKKDILAAWHAFGYHTTLFTDPLYLGKYPEYMVKLLGDNMPDMEKDDMEIIKIGSGLESFGVNYYRGKIIQHNESRDVKFNEVIFPHGITNGLGWPVSTGPTYPDAFYDLLCQLYNMYKEFGMKQIYITENGTCWNDTISPDGKVIDEFRIFYLREHLQQVNKAILAKVPIKAYFLWTLMDNFEWELGYKPGSNFGIVHIERETMNRIPKSSFFWYKKVIKDNKLH